MGFVVLWESLLLLRLLRIPNLTSASPWFPPRFPLCLLPHLDRKSQIFFWTNLMYFFLPSLFCLSPLLPEGEGLFPLQGMVGLSDITSKAFLASVHPGKICCVLISVSGHSSHSYVPGQCQWVVLHGRALLYRLVDRVSHVQKESV